MHPVYSTLNLFCNVPTNQVERDAVMFDSFAWLLISCLYLFFQNNRYDEWNKQKEPNRWVLQGYNGGKGKIDTEIQLVMEETGAEKGSGDYPEPNISAHPNRTRSDD